MRFPSSSEEIGSKTYLGTLRGPLRNTFYNTSRKSRRVARLECVVPVTVKPMGLQPERTHLVVRNLLAGFVLAGIE
jgi:hypothetical protein